MIAFQLGHLLLIGETSNADHTLYLLVRFDELAGNVGKVAVRKVRHGAISGLSALGSYLVSELLISK